MGIDGKDFGIIAGVAAGSALFGGAIGYFLGGKESCSKTKTYAQEVGGNKSFLSTGDTINDYVVANSLREPEILRELREYTIANVDMSLMITDPLQCQLFRVLLGMLNAKKCMEVGVFTGYNLLNVALSLPEDGKVYGLDMNARWVDHGRPFFKRANVDHKMDIRIGRADTEMDKLIAEGHAGSFDFIYVDANKEGYNDYYEKSLVLLRKGGLIALDNMLQSGRVVKIKELSKPSQISEATALNDLNKKIHKDDRVSIVFLNIADGCNLALKL